MPIPAPGSDYPSFKGLFHAGHRPIENLNTFIHAEDEMFLYALAVHGHNPDYAAKVYFLQGFAMLNLVRQIAKWGFGDIDSIPSFLDFACGYGRFARFLSASLPPDRIWASDLYAEGVAFLSDQLGVNGIVSTADPDDYPCKRHFDFIYVASLFTHLPEKTFARWLARLYRLLTPQGVLVFSVNDESIALAGQSMPPEGFLFLPQSESRSHDTQQYGSTWVTEPFIRRTIEHVCGGDHPCLRLPKGLLHFQDLYILPAAPDACFTGLNVDTGVLGHIDQCLLSTPGQLKFAGWAATSAPGKKAQRVQAWINGTLVGQCATGLPRPDVADHYKRPDMQETGWECTIPWNGDEDAWITFRIPGETGVDHVLDVGTVSSFLKKPTPSRAPTAASRISGKPPEPLPPASECGAG